MNLARMSVGKLESLMASVQKEIKRREEIEANRSQAQNELKALATKFGMSVEELVVGKNASRSGPRTKVAPKYRNPDNPAETWTGRGRTPKWVQEAEKKHGGRDKLAI
ncbi:MAG: H-NS histone family protein [Candidatus Latescibacterota bacterium]|nr:H-NS histone family protein [Candidatus Latescibacterota bacterium]